MIAEIQQVEPEGLKKFKITITVESIDEAREMWHRFNISFSQLKNGYGDSRNFSCPIPLYGGMNNVWGILDDYMIDHELKG